MRYALAIALILLPGCASLPSGTADALANAGGGCAKATGMWGSAVLMTVNADKGSIRNGEVSISGDCQGMILRDAASVRAVPPVPGTVTTTVVPGTTTTTVAPGK